MKIERAKTAFAPITMVIETEEELEGLLFALRYLAERGVRTRNTARAQVDASKRIYDKLVEASAEW
jgi:hypothetical protein